jgi:hypothetical protein
MSWLSFTAGKWFSAALNYRQAMRWARLERKSYKIPEPDIDVAAKAESGDLPLFLRADRN